MPFLSESSADRELDRLHALEAEAEARDEYERGQAEAENAELDWQSRLAYAEAWAGLSRAVGRAVSAEVMREAHAYARTVADLVPYRSALRTAMRHAWQRARRCDLRTLRVQALAWGAAAKSAGCRFNVERKAAEAVAFTMRHDLGSLSVPTKLEGTAARQVAAESAAARMEARPGWIVGTYGIEANGAAVALGAELGRVQAKHRRWIAALGAVRFAVIAVTGGREVEVEPGRTVRTTRGVNVALEGGAAAVWHSAAGFAPAPPPVELAPRETGPTLDEREAEMRYLFG